MAYKSAGKILKPDSRFDNLCVVELEGVRLMSLEGQLPDIRYVVAEGSKRMRYLHALRQRGEGAGPHELFVLTTPQAA